MNKILVKSPNGEIMLPCTNERHGVLCGSCHKFFAYPITVGDKCPHCAAEVIEALGDFLDSFTYKSPPRDDLTELLLNLPRRAAKEREDTEKANEEIGIFIVEATPMLAVTFHDRLPFVVGVNKIDYDNPFCSASHTVKYTLTFNGARDYAERLGFKFVPKAPRFVCACFGTYIDDKDL